MHIALYPPSEPLPLEPGKASSAALLEQMEKAVVTNLLIKAKGIQTYYGASHILRGVNFSVAQGETIGLMGRNGMGKKIGRAHV